VQQQGLALAVGQRGDRLGHPRPQIGRVDGRGHTLRVVLGREAPGEQPRGRVEPACLAAAVAGEQVGRDPVQPGAGIRT
jgi:hypothetical protein